MTDARPLRATVVIPTFDNGEPIRYALASALAQTIDDIEVFVIGDGCVDVTRDIVADVAGHDPRVRFFDRPKGERHGELHRHQALSEARGEIVCYLCDDDLWLPNHLEEMGALLTDADFAGAATLLVYGDESVDTWLTDLSDPTDRARVRDDHHDLNLSAMGHRLDAYRRLPYGWRTTPAGFHTDHWMTRQWLAEPWVRAVSGTVITNIHPANSYWQDRSVDDKVALTARYAAHIADEQWRREVWPSIVLDATRNGWNRSKQRERRFETSYQHLTTTRWWRARRQAVALLSRVGRARPGGARAGRGAPPG
jgi:glycosyltransferase involved in cell wall biosynthesis